MRAACGRVDELFHQASEFGDAFGFFPIKIVLLRRIFAQVVKLAGLITSLQFWGFGESAGARLIDQFPIA